MRGNTGGLDVENESGGGGWQVGELLLEVGRCVEGLSIAHRDAHIGSHKTQNLLAMAIPTRYSQIVPLGTKLQARTRVEGSILPRG